MASGTLLFFSTRSAIACSNWSIWIDCGRNRLRTALDIGRGHDGAPSSALY
jgi:hypothetical protein